MAKIPSLKERLFGLTGPQGNHGEDVKEVYYYLDATPTNSYLKGLYKYPQAAFPYEQLLTESSRRNRFNPEYELEDTGVFNENRYFDVFAEYAKNDVDDIFIRVTIVNRGPDSANVALLPTLWFRNTWSWCASPEMPKLIRRRLLSDPRRTSHSRHVYCSPSKATRRCSSPKTKPTPNASTAGAATTLSIRTPSTNI